MPTSSVVALAHASVTSSRSAQQHASATVAALRQMLHEKTGRELDVTMYNGRMEVHGHHVKLIKSWLRQLGF